jgi:hypothetical protein
MHFQSATLRKAIGEPSLHVLARVEIVHRSDGTSTWHGHINGGEIHSVVEASYLLSLFDGRAGPIVIHEVRGTGDKREAFFWGTGVLTGKPTLQPQEQND